MEKVSYVLKTKCGSPFFVFDSIVRAKDEIAKRKKKGIALRLFEQHVVEREIEL